MKCAAYEVKTLELTVRLMTLRRLLIPKPGFN